LQSAVVIATAIAIRSVSQSVRQSVTMC